MKEELEQVLDLYENMPAEGQQHWKARSLPSIRFDSEVEREEFLAALQEREKKPAAAQPKTQQPAATTRVFQTGQRVKVNLAGLRVGKVTLSENVEAVYAVIERVQSSQPLVYRVRLLISFKGLEEVDVPAERIRPL